MAKPFKLNDKQKKVLLDWGYREDEITQMEECVNCGTITNENTHRVLSWKTALKRLGEKDFLSGIGRASFHWTAMRGEGDVRIYFDFSNYFK